MRKIIVTSHSLRVDNGDNIIGCAFWLTTPSNMIVAKTRHSAVLNITVDEQAALNAGTITEQSVPLQYISSDQAIADIEATLEGQYATAQAAIDAANPPIGNLNLLSLDSDTGWSA